MNGHTAFKAALSIPAQSISSFMMCFLSWFWLWCVVVACCWVLFSAVGGAVLSAVQYVGSTGPTVLPIRKVPLALMSDPLDNHEIAFGVVHFALRRFP
jgi:hypothetical protein